jgi:hypothetical protein
MHEAPQGGLYTVLKLPGQGLIYQIHDKYSLKHIFFNNIFHNLYFCSYMHLLTLIEV